MMKRLSHSNQIVFMNAYYGVVAIAAAIPPQTYYRALGQRAPGSERLAIGELRPATFQSCLGLQRDFEKAPNG
jgi:hypothetical protein